FMLLFLGTVFLIAKEPTNANPHKHPPSNPIDSYANVNQDIEVTGKVTAENGEFLPGVNVLVKGSATGTVTNLEGEYNLSVPNPTATLVFSFIGYTTQEVALNGRTSVDVVLVNESQALSEVVVTAFGLERKRESLV